MIRYLSDRCDYASGHTRDNGAISPMAFEAEKPLNYVSAMGGQDIIEDL